MAISQDDKLRVVELIMAGQLWPAAIAQVGVQVSESTAYRWVRCWRRAGLAGLSDGRHGHASKMTSEIETWLKEYCGQAPHTPSRAVKQRLQEQFKVEISRGHLNRVRAELGVSRLKKSPS
jgi:transposase